MEDTGSTLRRSVIGLAFSLLLIGPGLALAQCPNNCSGHGECMPSEKKRRFECECSEGWSGQACSQRVSARAKAKEPPAELIVEEPQDFEGEDAGGNRAQSGSVRELDEITRYKWANLSGREQALLKGLGWKEATWNAKDSPRTIWPLAMHKPYNLLDAVEQAAVRAFYLTPNEWNTGKHLALLMHPTD